MKRINISIVASLLLAGVVTGCGGKKTDSNTPQPGVTTYGIFRPLKTTSTSQSSLMSNNKTVNMSYKRYNHGAINLPNGQVMLFGVESIAWNDIPTTSFAEYFDPISERFEVKAPLKFMYRPKPGHVFDADNVNVYLFGAYNIDSTKFLSIEKFNTESYTSELVNVPFENVTNHTSYDLSTFAWMDGVHFATRQDNLILVVCNFYSGTENPTVLLKYDLTTGAMDVYPFRSVYEEIESSATYLTQDNKIRMIGGWDKANSKAYTDVYEFDLATNTGSNGFNMSIPIHSAMEQIDPNVFVIYGKYYGGSETDMTSEIYKLDLNNQTMIQIGTLATPIQSSASATRLTNGFTLIAGGNHSSFTPNAAPEQVFNVTNGAKGMTGTMTVARSQHKSVLMNNGKVLITGGRKDFGPSGLDNANTAEIYDSLQKLYVLFTSAVIKQTDVFNATCDYTAGVNWTINNFNPAKPNGTITSTPNSISFTPPAFQPGDKEYVFELKAVAKDNPEITAEIQILVRK